MHPIRSSINGFQPAHRSIEQMHAGTGHRALPGLLDQLFDLRNDRPRALLPGDADLSRFPLTDDGEFEHAQSVTCGRNEPLSPDHRAGRQPYGKGASPAGVLLTLIDPPIASTRRLQIASPSPAPRFPLLLRSWKNS